MATMKFERVYDGPVEDIWELWTTKDGFAEWFTPPGCTVEVTALDLRVGGSFDHVMTMVGAEEVATMDRLGMSRSALCRAQFVEVIPHQKLHIRFNMDFIPGVEPYPYNMVVELLAEGERIRMVVTVDAHPDAERTRLANETFAKQLVLFDSLLTSRRTRQ